MTTGLLYVMLYCVFVTFPCDVLGQVWCWIVSSPDFASCLTLKKYFDLSHTYTSIALDTRLLAQAYQPSQIELSSSGIQKSSRGLIRGLIPGLIFSCPDLPSKRAVKDSCTVKWQNRWEASQAGRHMYDLHPTVKAKRKQQIASQPSE